MALMTIGSPPDLFVFESKNLMPEKFTKARAQKVSRHKQHGKADILQHNGPGKESLSFTGSIFPFSDFGTAESLDLLHELASQGEQRLIINGNDMGKWMIFDISETHENLNASAKAHVINFGFRLEKQG